MYIKVFPIFDPKRVGDFEDDFPVGKHDFEQDIYSVSCSIDAALKHHKLKENNNFYLYVSICNFERFFGMILLTSTSFITDFSVFAFFMISIVAAIFIAKAMIDNRTFVDMNKVSLDHAINLLRDIPVQSYENMIVPAVTQQQISEFQRDERPIY
ncbi:MAG: hypothetical protein IJ675_06685, partial [Pseudobutyrivibrio sp.]|nr:hypothetical protein [Pseudobutyrivibrio sp.]